MNSKGSLKLTDLKVADLKAELEKRGLDKTGTKSRLLEKLSQALSDEGIDPDEHEFDSEVNLKGTKRKAEAGVSSEAGEEEDMETGEIDLNDVPEKCVTLDDDDEDTPVSDEEMDHYNEHKEDTESARFKTSALTRSDASPDEEAEKETNAENLNSGGIDAPKKMENEILNSDVVDSNSTDSKGNKSKVLKVIGKDKVQQVALTARTLWVTGLASTSKVSDLKNLFSKHGKVTSAKIVRSTKGTQRKWYGLLTMATSKDASKCIQKLHRTELGGHVISVERRQTAPIVKKSEASVVKKTVTKNEDSDANKTDAEPKKDDDVEKEEAEAGEEKDKSDDGRSSDDRGYRGHEGRPYFRGRFNRGGTFRRPFGFRGARGGGFRGRGRFMGGGFRRPFGRPQFDRPGFRPFSRGYGYDSYKSRGARMPPRDYDREMRMKRDDEHEEMYRHKIIVRKQREEAYRLEKEKHQLRIEREMLEREKAEMLKIEKAKQRMEREELEMEREKLRRHAQMSVKRPFMRRGGGHMWGEKRRDPSYEGSPSSSGFQREKFTNDKFQYNRSSYKKPEFGHEEFRREKIDISPQHPKFSEREERREVTYHGGPDRRVYTRNEFRGGAHPGPSSSPKHFVPRNKSPRDDWKFHERRGSGEKPGYAPRGHKRMNYY